MSSASSEIESWFLIPLISPHVCQFHLKVIKKLQYFSRFCFSLKILLFMSGEGLEMDEAAELEIVRGDSRAERQRSRVYTPPS